jgi:hypothetical protein
MVDLHNFGSSDLLSLIFYLTITAFLWFRIRTFGIFFSKIILALSGVHLIMTLFFYYNSLISSADSSMYYTTTYFSTSAWFDTFGYDIAFIQFFTYPLIHYIKLSYLGCFFVFSSFGLIGYYYLLKTILFLQKKYSLSALKKYYYFFLLPGAHFFTNAIGKDSIVFFSICIIVYGFICKKYRFLVLGMLIVSYIRIHILVALLVGLVLNLLFTKGASLVQKIVGAITLSVALLVFLPVLSSRLNIENISGESVNQYLDQTATLNQGEGSSIDMSGYPLPLKIVSYLFRPLFFDARSAMTLISSFENLAWIYLLWMIFQNFRINFNRRSFSSVFSLTLFPMFVTLIMLASVITNLGIAMRQKTMLLPFVFILFFLSQDTYWRRLKKDGVRP